MFTLALLSLAGIVVFMAAVRIRGTYRHPKYMEQRRSMATRIVRPYAVVEAYDAQGNAVLPTLVYDADQLDLATERYTALGCSVVIGTVFDTAETAFGAGATSVH